MKATKAIKQIKSSQKCEGFALLVVAIFIALGSLIVSSFAQLAFHDTSFSHHKELSQKALLLAEAGANEAYALLKADFNNKNNADLFPETDLGEGSYDVTIIEVGGYVVLESTASVKGVEKTISMTVSSNSGTEAFDYAFFSNDNMDLQGNPDATGNIHSNKNVFISGNPVVSGTASASTQVIVTGSPTINNIVEGVPIVDFPDIDFNDYYNLAAPEDRYTGNKNWAGNQNLSPTNGIIYVNGNVQINGNLNITGAIVATGSIKVNGNVTQTGVEGMPLLMSRDSYIRINGNVLSAEGLIYSKTNNVQIYGNVNMTGQIISFGELLITGNPSVIASSEIPSGLQDTPDEGIKIVSYFE